MTSNEFNEKYKDHLEEGFEGLVFLNEEIIDYCACHTGYNVLFEMKNGSTYKLKDVCDMMGE